MVFYVQGEEGGFPVRARIQAQKATTGQAGGNGSRDYGGTGVFLPRVANNNGYQRKTGEVSIYMPARLLLLCIFSFYGSEILI